MRRALNVGDDWRHPLERPPAVIINEDDPTPERSLTVRRDPPTDDAPAPPAPCDCGGFGCPACDPSLREPDAGGAQAADQADAGGPTDEDWKRWLD